MHSIICFNAFQIGYDIKSVKHTPSIMFYLRNHLLVNVQASAGLNSVQKFIVS